MNIFEKLESSALIEKNADQLSDDLEQGIQALRSLPFVESGDALLHPITNLCAYSSHLVFAITTHKNTTKKQTERALSLLNELSSLTGFLEDLILSALRIYFPQLSLREAMDFRLMHALSDDLEKGLQGSRSKVQSLMLCLDGIHDIRMPGKLPFRIGLLREWLLPSE